MDIILYLLTIIQYLYQMNCWLLISDELLVIKFYLQIHPAQTVGV